MTSRWRTVAVVAATAATTGMASIATRAAEPVSLAAFIALERPKADFELRYGPGPSQAIDVFLPPGSEPRPVAILVHGGCWSATTGGREQLRHIGAELARRGIAVWSIGYRRANEAGGGYPGTYEDVATAVDRLRTEAGDLRLDLSRTVLIGHSAGGHLALWAAAREVLPHDSPLRTDRPFVPSRVISVAGVGDLKAFMPAIPGICGPEVAARLTGAASAARPDPFSDTSPAALPAPAARVELLSGVLDRLVPPYVAHDHARAMRAKGKDTALINVEGAGHFDFMTPGTPAWDEVRRRTEDALGVVPAFQGGGALNGSRLALASRATRIGG
jgi:acetyl esterase/lipase